MASFVDVPQMMEHERTALEPLVMQITYDTEENRGKPSGNITWSGYTRLWQGETTRPLEGEATLYTVVEFETERCSKALLVGNTATNKNENQGD